MAGIPHSQRLVKEMGMCAAQFLIPIRVSRNSESWWFIRKNQSEWDVDIYIRSTLYISRRDERYEGSGARWRIFWLLSSFAADASRWSCPFSFLRASERAREKFVVGIKQKIEEKKNSFLSLSLSSCFSGPLDVEILSSPSLGRRPVK